MNFPESLLNFPAISTTQISLAELIAKNCQAAVLRLDLLHPVISGNKWFKLKYHLEQAVKDGYQKILTFGGPYSNHLAATSLALRESGLDGIAVIRGEKPKELSQTLNFILNNGLKLHFISREEYREKDLAVLRDLFGDFYLIPEGGAGEAGIKGSEEILSFTNYQNFTHILCAIGTGTTFLGLCRRAKPGQEVIGIPVLKGVENLTFNLSEKLENKIVTKFFSDYHFGGYAKKNETLLNFMNEFFAKTGIPTDFVYTGKLFYAFFDLLKKDYFTPGSRVLLIHSGGLQGNNSLAKGTLFF